MKKLLVLIVLLLVISLGAVYIFIPSSQHIHYTVETDAPFKAVQRLINDKQRWSQWWPGKKMDDKSFEHNGFHYHIQAVMINGFNATVSNGEDSLHVKFVFSPFEKNGTSLEWNSGVELPANPITRLIAAKKVADFKANLLGVLDSVQAILNDPARIYGFRPEVVKLTDQFLIAANEEMNHYPTVEEVYKLVYGVRDFIKSKAGVEKNAPMMNVYKLSDSTYHLMVAIPTTRALSGEGAFTFKQMVLGFIATGEVKGGWYTARQAEKEMENYVNDNNKTSPAAPYQMLVTDRLKEADTSKWITRLYYPVYF